MALFNCSCKKDCTLFAVVASLILGVIAAFLQITAVITVTPAFLWVALGIAVGYLGILLITNRASCTPCVRNTLGTVLTGILGTILFAVVLLAVGITATSVVSAILVGLLVAFLTLTFTGSACLVLCLADCDN